MAALRSRTLRRLRSPVALGIDDGGAQLTLHRGLADGFVWKRGSARRHHRQVEKDDWDFAKGAADRGGYDRVCSVIRRRSSLRSAGLATRARASNDHGGLAVAELDCISRSAGPYRFSRSCVEKTTSPTIRTWPCASSVPRVTARHRRQHEEELPQRARDAGGGD